MDTIICLCAKCKSELGRFKNSWNGIGNTYHSPVYPPLSIKGLESTGDVYNGAADSVIEHSLLHDIACIMCHTVVGLRCDSAPEGHLLKQNQLILRLTDMSVFLGGSGQKAKISVLKSYPLMATSGRRLSGASRATTAQPSLRAPLSVSRITNPAYQSVVSMTPTTDDRLSVAPSKSPISEIVRFKNWAEDAINTQQKDIDRISETVNRIERDTRSLKDFMLEVRNGLSSHRKLPHCSGEEDILALQEDLHELREQVEQNGQAITHRSIDLSLRSLDVIAQDVDEIGLKVTEVDDLKLELAKMKARVDYLEETKRSELPAKAPATELERSQEPISGSSKRKHDQLGDLRSSEEEGDEHLQEPSLKRRRVANFSSSGEENPISDNRVGKTPDYQTPLSREIIEIFSSSDADPSSPAHAEYQDDASIADVSTPDAVASAPALKAVSGNRQMPASMQTPTNNQGPTSAPRQFPRRENISLVEVRVPYRSILNMSNRQQSPRVRNSNGVLLLPDGRVDRRSLRFKGPKGDKENTMPAQSPDTPEVDKQSLLSKKPRGEKQSNTSVHPDRDPDDDSQNSNVNDINNGDPEGEYAPILPPKEVRRSTPAASTRLSRNTPFSSSPIAVDTEALSESEKKKVYHCGACGKGYQKIQGLDYHHAHSKGPCNNRDKDDVPPRSYQCDKCKKAYSVPQGLEYHLKHSKCSPNPIRVSSANPITCDLCGREWSNLFGYYGHKCMRGQNKAKEALIKQREQTLEVRERELAERERFVRETLERELGY